MEDVKHGLDPNELEILENYTIKDWERWTKKMQPFTLALLKIYASVDGEKRANIATGMSEIGEAGDEYAEMITHLAALSDSAYEKIRKVIGE